MVVDGDRVVSTATLLDETVRVGDVVLPAGQVELVATHTGYEGRGLVRALMGWAHDRSRDRGHLLQVMIGIPYFYRLFGYEYAIDIPPGSTSARVAQHRRRRAEAGRSSAGDRPGDLPSLVALQDAAQARYDVSDAAPGGRLALVARARGEHDRVLERDGVVVASARTGPAGRRVARRGSGRGGHGRVARPPRRPAYARRAVDDRAPAADHAGPGLGGPPRPRRDGRDAVLRAAGAPRAGAGCASPRCSRRACAPRGSAGTW